jgi:small subunit ribosomal protein S3
MGQKVRPTGYRVGVTEEWRSKWFASRAEFRSLLLEDFKIRTFLKKRFEFASISKIGIDRTRDQVVVSLSTGRPGIIIGRKGQEVERLKAELEDLTGRRTDIKVLELAQPLHSAVLAAEDIAQQLVRRGSFRRVIKRCIDQVMESGVDGIKIELSGRLGGAEMSRTEKANAGSIPLSTLRRDIDYGFAMAKTTMGVIGVKVWINRGEYSVLENGNGADAQAGQASKRTKRQSKR